MIVRSRKRFEAERIDPSHVVRKGEPTCHRCGHPRSSHRRVVLKWRDGGGEMADACPGSWVVTDPQTRESRILPGPEFHQQFAIIPERTESE